MIIDTINRETGSILEDSVNLMGYLCILDRNLFESKWQILYNNYLDKMLREKNNPINFCQAIQSFTELSL